MLLNVYDMKHLISYILFEDIFTDDFILNEGMIVLEGGHTDHKAISNTIPISHLSNREPEINIHDPNDQNLIQGFNGDMSLQDMYNKEGDFDDKDDSDWEPLEKHLTIVKWFCVNCTMVNVDGAFYCHV